MQYTWNMNLFKLVTVGLKRYAVMLTELALTDDTSSWSRQYSELRLQVEGAWLFVYSNILSLTLAT